MCAYRDPVTKQIIVSFYHVYNQLGLGFLESVYRRALRVALTQAGLHVAEEVPVEVIFDGVGVGLFRTDLLVDGRIAVEIKAAKAIDAAHIAQVINFLRAKNLRPPA